MLSKKIIAGILLAATVATSGNSAPVTAIASTKTVSQLSSEAKNGIKNIKKAAEKYSRLKKDHDKKTKEKPGADAGFGKLSANKDLTSGKVTDIVFNFHPSTVSGSSVVYNDPAKQDPDKTYSLYEITTYPIAYNKHIKDFLKKHDKKYKKIATLKYYDQGIKVRGFYTYRAEVTLKRSARPLINNPYKFVVIDDKNKKIRSNVVKLYALQEKDKCDCDDCCCRNCSCGEKRAPMKKAKRNVRYIVRADK